MKWVLNHSYKCIIIDKPSYESLCVKGFKDKIVLIPNPCSKGVEKIAQESVQTKYMNHYIFVGHVVRTKGVYELVTAFTKIPMSLKLEIIGPYEEYDKKALEHIAKGKDSGNWLNIVGSKDKSYVLESMKKATAMVFPTYTEGFPNVVMEAMACGCPVLATNVAAIPDMLDVDKLEKACGVCYKKKSVEEIVKVLKLFTTKKSFQSKYAKNGKAKVLSAYTMDIVFPMYEEVWK